MYLDEKDKVLYVGKAKNLKARVSSYFLNSSSLGSKTAVLVAKIRKIRVTVVESELEALLLEAFYIKKFKPKYNIKLTDNKSYVKIRITKQDTYPRVLLARMHEEKGSVYFGPFPSSGAVKLVLKMIRRVYPFQSVRNHAKRVCLYNHLGLCPCPPVFDSVDLQKQYAKNIRGIIRILEGKSRIILKELEKERDRMSTNEAFEQALLLQKKITALRLITQPHHKPFEYDLNPNLRSDLRERELDELRDALHAQGLALQELERIECYDISNIQGTHATASMVVFTNGEKDTGQYRKFRIRREWDRRKKKDLPNDFAMMREVLKRRFKHEEWNMPSLVIVDGGKGQVASALIALAESDITVPLIGLAKREETIIIPVIARSEERTTKQSDSGKSENSSQSSVTSYKELLNLRFAGNPTEKINTIIVREENFIEISFPKNSPASQLVQRIRDEAHRFAITYHRKLRSKAML